MFRRMFNVTGRIVVSGVCVFFDAVVFLKEVLYYTIHAVCNEVMFNRIHDIKFCRVTVSNG